MDATIIHPLASAIIFAILGITVFCAGFWAIDRVTPYHLWLEIVEKQNTALAIVVGAFAIAIGLIISASIHG